jgi:hypothetical protein
MMAQGKAQHSHDPYAQRAKTLASSVQRLRGWVGSDPSKAPELADALVELTAHRLLGHGYASAAADAQEAVRRAAELLAAKGPLGPYTSITDAVRYVTAVIQLAAIQTGLGMPDAAGRTIESLRDINDQLGDGLRSHLKPQTAIWALLCSARAALASMDVAAANAYADATRARLAESGLDDVPDANYLSMDVDRLASDSRWAGGRAEEAIAFLYAAKVRYDTVVDGRLQESARLSPALLERLAEPLAGLYGDLADRLLMTGEIDLGMATRRTLIQLLREPSGRLGDHSRAQLASAYADLGRDLEASGRLFEADAARAEAAAVMPHGQPVDEDHGSATLSPGAQILAGAPLSPSAAFAASTASTKIVDLAALQAEHQRRKAAWLEAERPGAHQHELRLMDQARVDAEYREAEEANAKQAEAARLAVERARAEEEQRLEATRQAAAEETERLERKRRREARIEAHRLEAEKRDAEQREAERLEAERIELERLQAQIDELERTEKPSHEQ